MRDQFTDIITYKRTQELPRLKRERTLERLRAQATFAPPVQDFRAALVGTPGARPRLIAEVKRASPSKGLIARGAFDPAIIAQTYASHGAAAVSVLTDAKFFQGHMAHLEAVKALGRLPVLRKDFIIDEYQLVEARAGGADAVLLIVAALSARDLTHLLDTARRLGLSALVEVHTADETRRALDAGAELIGINNRDLHTFAVDLATTEALRPLIPPGPLVVAESGITRSADVERMQACGVDAVLVGEALMRLKPDERARLVRELARGTAAP